MSDTLSSLWPRFQLLPLWARIAGWLFAWPILVPLWLLSGPPARWRQLAALGSFAVLGLFWITMWAGAITRDSAAETSETQAEAVLRTETTTAPAEATRAVAESTEATSTAMGGSPTSTSGTEGTPTSAPSQETPGSTQAAEWTVSRIIDGDTVEVQSPDGSMETVRVVGIDTPERGECGFSEAGEALARMVLDQPVDLVPGAQDDRDRYGRILRYIDVRGVDAGLELIRGGFAIARYDSRDGYGRHYREDTYVTADARAIHICESVAPTTAAAATEPPPEATPPPAPAAKTPAGSVQVFARCTNLNAVYPGGVARVGVQGNMVSGELRPFGRQPVFDDALYAANSARDGDGDGIACEK